MNNPGVWVLGSTDDMDRNMGMGIVIEYANQQGTPQWKALPKDDWDYTLFAHTTRRLVDLMREIVPGCRAVEGTCRAA